LGLNVQNENTTDIPYDGFDGELTYLGKSLTAIKSVKSALVRGHSTTEVQFTFSISLDNIKTVFGSNWGQFVSNFKNFTVYSNFHLKGELFFTVVDRKITYRLDQPLSKPS
jgi:LEA14-like dessication related protein